MKVFKKSDNNNTRIAGEILNVESRKKLFENGQFLALPEHEDYTQFSNNGKIKVIYPYCGYIIGYRGDFTSISQEITRLQEKKEISDVLKKYNHGSGYIPIYSGNSGCTITKNKITTDNYFIETEYGFHTNKFIQRRFINNTRPKRRSDKKQIFTWFILEPSIVFSGYFRADNKNRFEFFLNNFMFSIYIDDDNVLTIKDNERIIRYLKPSDFTLYKHFACITKTGINKNPSSFNSDIVLKYSKYVRGDKMIQELCGYDLGSSLTVRNLNRDSKHIFYVDFSKIKIDNKKLGAECLKTLLSVQRLYSWLNYQEISDDRCLLCKTPLYDEIYVVFPDHKNLACYAVCKICMHSKINLLDGLYQAKGSLGDGVFGYSNTDLIAHTIFNKTRKDILSEIKIDQELKDIINAMYSSTSEDPTILTTNKAKYIIINYTRGSIPEYIDENLRKIVEKNSDMILIMGKPELNILERK
jgi:hypothetical protein